MRVIGQSGQREAGHGTARDLEFLIANLELEFHISPIRISNLKFSNRKFFAIFSLKPDGDRKPRAAFSSPRPPASSIQNLIVTPRLEFRPTCTKQNGSSKSNRYKTAFSLINEYLRRSTAHHPSLVTSLASRPRHA
jgi:hypothetical protein